MTRDEYLSARPCELEALAEMVEAELDRQDSREADLMWMVYTSAPRGKGKRLKYEDFLRRGKAKVYPSTEELMGKVKAMCLALGGSVVD